MIINKATIKQGRTKITQLRKPRVKSLRLSTKSQDKAGVSWVRAAMLEIKKTGKAVFREIPKPEPKKDPLPSKHQAIIALEGNDNKIVIRDRTQNCRCFDALKLRSNRRESKLNRRNSKAMKRARPKACNTERPILKPRRV